MAMAHSERGCLPFAMPQSLMWKRNAASRIPQLHSFPLFRFILPVLFSVFLVFLLSTLLVLALQLRGQRISWTPRIPYQKQQAPFSPSQSLPLQLRAARYGPYVPHFYKLLTHWLRNKRYKPSFMKELLKIVKSPLDSHYRRFRRVATPSKGKRYASCAVVGNSGILLRQRRGSFIDKHEMVIRLNNADTKGYEAFVGSKTTLAFVNSNIFHDCRRQNKCQCQSYGETVAIIMYICQVLHFMDVAICNQQIKAPLLITEARFDGLCTRIVKYYSLRNFVKTTGLPAKKWNTAHDGAFFHYSSGMQAVMLALGICEKVSILGFGKASNASHHYHSRQAKEIDIHDYAAEYLFYNDLVHNRTDIIPFLKDAGLSIPSVHIYD